MIKKRKFATGGQIKPVQDITELYPDMLNFVLQQTQQQPIYDQSQPRNPRLPRPGINFISQGSKVSEKQNSIQGVETKPRPESVEEEDEDLPEVSEEEQQIEDSFLKGFTGKRKRVTAPGRRNVNSITDTTGVNSSAIELKNYFDSKGIPSHISAGIVGNISAESGFRSGVQNSIGAFGLGQWLGDRKKNLNSFAKKDGRKVTDPTLQADFIIHELNTSEGAAYKELLKTHTPQEAALVFGEKYERPSAKELEGSLQHRIRVANSVSQNNNDMKKGKNPKYATGGQTPGMGNMPWGTIINGGIQIADMLANNPADSYTDQPLMTIKPTSMATNPYSRGFQYATGGAIAKSYGFGETPEGLTEAQLNALNGFIPYPAQQAEISAPVAQAVPDLEDPYYSQNPNGSFAINTAKINKDRTAKSGLIGDNYSVHTNRAFGYEGLYGNKNYLITYATGGVVPMQGVEVEDDEVAQTPDGQLMEFDGPTHEEGGIDVNLPEGTKIYSDRIKMDGKTMQERKKDREKVLARMNKMLTKNPSDPFAKNALTRVTQANELQDQRDMQMQEAAKEIYQGGLPPKYGHGGRVGNRYATGGMVYNPQTGMFDQVQAPDVQIPYAPNYIAPIASDTDPTLSVSQPTGTMMQPPASISTAQAGSQGYNPDDYTDSTNTIGNVVGMAGSAFGAVAPLINTLNNARDTKPNRNFYKNFGKNAIDTNTQAQTYVAGQQTNALTDLSTQRNAARINARNSARSIQTVRALDIAGDMGANKGMNDIYNTFSQQMMNLLGQRSQLQNQQDQFVMSGEHQADIANRQDVDNFYSNFGRDLQSLAGGIQGAGRQLNQVQQNDDALGFINDQGEHVKYMRNRRTGKYELVPIS